MAELAPLPRATQTIDQTFLIEALGGPKGVISYLDSFPEEVYNKSIDSHLVKFMYSLLGPAGIGTLRRNYLETRLIFEAHGLELFNLDHFYGNPFQFGRIAEEVYEEDIRGLIPQDKWEEIRSKDARYRNRAIDFMAGARAGNTPFGMRLVARSGLGHEAEIVENYKYLFDRVSDDPLGLKRYGKTNFLNEMVILPRQETSRSEVQKITILGSPTGGSFVLRIPESNAVTDAIPYNASRQEVEIAVTELLGATHGNIQVSGGPLPDQPLILRYMGTLGAQNLTPLEATGAFTGGDGPQILITTTIQGFDASSEVVAIKPRDQKHLQEAIDRVRPVGVIPTVVEAPGVRSAVGWVRASASSEFDEMIRYVTGSGRVTWPPRTTVHWIESGKEHQAVRAHGDLGYHYNNFHAINKVVSYSEDALIQADYSSASGVRAPYALEHIGAYEPRHSALFPLLRSVPENHVVRADMILADYAEPLTVDRVVETPAGSIGLVNGIYPTDYQDLPGVPAIKYTTEQFWSSSERTSGDVYIEIDFGVVRAVNYLSFEVTRKPVTIDIDYDCLSLSTGERRFVPVNYPTAMPNSRTLFFSATELNPWAKVALYFTNARNEMIYTRFVRIKISRRTQDGFLGTGIPWSVDARNLRIGRSIANQ